VKTLLLFLALAFAATTPAQTNNADVLESLTNILESIPAPPVWTNGAFVLESPQLQAYNAALEYNNALEESITVDNSMGEAEHAMDELKYLDRVHSWAQSVYLSNLKKDGKNEAIIAEGITRNIPAYGFLRITAPNPDIAPAIAGNDPDDLATLRAARIIQATQDMKADNEKTRAKTAKLKEDIIKKLGEYR